MLVLCLLEYLKLNSRRERGESHFFIQRRGPFLFLFPKKLHEQNRLPHLSVDVRARLILIQLCFFPKFTCGFYIKFSKGKQGN